MMMMMVVVMVVMMMMTAAVGLHACIVMVNVELQECMSDGMGLRE